MAIALWLDRSDDGSGTSTSSARPASSPSARTAAPAVPRSNLTTSQQQAARSAQSYISFQGFSRQGLIDQLSSEFGEKFSVADATAAVDSLSVNWNQQAVRSAESFLSLKPFSCQGLIDQLSSNYGEKFTGEQATFGARQTGIC
jgi:hypothetical protein